MKTTPAVLTARSSTKRSASHLTWPCWRSEFGLWWVARSNSCNFAERMAKPTAGAQLAPRTAPRQSASRLNLNLVLCPQTRPDRSEEHTSELQSPCNLVCRLLLEKKKKKYRLST